MTAVISPQTTIGAIALTVSDLPRALDFYTAKLGLRIHAQQDNAVQLGSGGQHPWLHLHAVPGARKAARTTGLYHFAILVPDRFTLAQTLRSLAEGEANFQGASDHGVSEALYLADPDGNGIEVYVDRPKGAWPRDENGQLEMVTDPLDIDDLLGELQRDPRPWDGQPAATRIGHIHLHVANLARAELFYTAVIGFDLVQRYGSSAAFLSAGGYHHHVGINTWNGAGAPPPPPDSVGLRWFALRLPDPAALEEVAARARTAGLPLEERPSGFSLADPSGNTILLDETNLPPKNIPSFG